MVLFLKKILYSHLKGQLALVFFSGRLIRGDESQSVSDYAFAHMHSLPSLYTIKQVYSMVWWHIDIEA